MKKLFFLIPCAAFMLYSCVNKAVDPKTPLTYAISAVVDGKYETFGSGDSVRAIGNNGVYIAGVNDTTSDKIALYVGNNSGFKTGTYTDTTDFNNQSSQILFYPAGDYTNYYYSYFIQSRYDFYSSVTVAALDSTHIQGTFNGNIVLVNYIGGTAALKTKSITNGQFNIKIKH